MLILTRKPGQAVKIKPDESLDPLTPVSAFFVDGPIEVVVTQVNGYQVKLGIRADPGFLILRDELSGGDPLENQRGR